jgi:hypothetical protein
MRLRICSLTAALLLLAAGALVAQPTCTGSLCNPSMDCMMPCYSTALQKTITCLQYGTCNRDPDGDGVLWEYDNCPRNANSNQADCDGDGVGDVCDSLNGTFVPTGSKTVCASDKDDHVVYFTIEVTYQQRFVDTSSCHAPDRWNHYVYSADCVNISDHYCCINDLLSSSDQWICTPIGQYSCNPDTIP